MLFKRVQKGSAYCAFPRESLNKVFTILENIEGEGCEIQKSFMGKHWKIVISKPTETISQTVNVITSVARGEGGLHFKTNDLVFTDGLLTAVNSGNDITMPGESVTLSFISGITFANNEITFQREQMTARKGLVTGSNTLSPFSLPISEC